MSKEHLNYLRRKTAEEAELWAADRIEELEREKTELMLKVTKFWCVAASYKNECDALLADIARLREALDRIVNGPWPSDMEGSEDQCRFDRDIATAALAKVRKP